MPTDDDETEIRKEVLQEEIDELGKDQEKQVCISFFIISTYMTLLKSREKK